MSQVKTLFDDLNARFSPTAAQQLKAVFQYQLKEGESYYFEIDNGNCTLGEGIHSQPSVTLKLKFDTLKKLADGELDGMKAFMFGKLKVTGDLMLAPRMAQLFPLAN